jgi:uncharacterized tellurite resistance protein B-like protein
MLGKAMIERIKVWLNGPEEQGVGGRDELEIVTAALLMEAARIDGTLDGEERAVVEQLLERRFGLSSEDAREMAVAAAADAERSTQLFGMTRVIKDRLGPERRIELIEFLWEVVYADGTLDPLEDTLMRQIGGLIEVSDPERGAARLRVLQRLGLSTES